MASTASPQVGGKVVATSLRTPNGWLVLALRTYFRLRRRCWRLTGRWFDLRLGVRTEEWTGVSTTPVDGNAHQPTPPALVRRALRAVPLDADDVVLDIGSGLGRVVFAIAGREDVRKVIGVEADPGLHRSAVRNAARCRAKLGRTDVRLVLGDAAGFDVPGEVTVVYMFNPFSSMTMAEVVQRIDLSLAENPRPMTLIYHWPIHGDLLTQYGFRREVVKPYLHLYRR